MTTIIDAGDPRAAAATDAVQQGDIAWLRQLLAENPELATAAFGTAGPGGMTRTLLHAATDWPGHRPNVAATIQVLVDAGAVIAGGTPLDDAVAFGQWQAAWRLVERGVHTKLFNAAALGLVDRVQAHLATDPPPEEVTAALWAACHGGQQATAEHLLQQGAELNWIAPWGGLTPLDAARRSDAHGLAPWLVARGAQSATEPTGTKD